MFLVPPDQRFVYTYIYIYNTARPLNLNRLMPNWGEGPSRRAPGAGPHVQDHTGLTASVHLPLAVNPSILQANIFYDSGGDTHCVL